MKLAILVKQTPDTETKPKIAGNGLDLTGVKFILNPYDEFAVEEAIQLRDKSSGSATVISLGPDRVVDAMRTGLAMGADDGIHVVVSEDELQKMDSYLTAKALAEAIKKHGPYDLIMAGKQAIDDDALAVPQMVAEFIGAQRATVVTKLEVGDDKKVKASRAIEGGAEERIELTLPAVIAAHKGLNTPRYASLPGIMKAKQKKIEKVTLADLGLSLDSAKVEFEGFELPPERKAGVRFEGEPAEIAAKLANALRNEAKVI